MAVVIEPRAVAAYAHGAGFSGNDLILAIAIAKAESGFNTMAHNTAGKDDSYGLMQINMKGALGPNRRKQFGISNNEGLYDPFINMTCALMIRRARGNFKDWSTYNNGAYKAHIPAAKAAIAGLQKAGSQWERDTVAHHGRAAGPNENFNDPADTASFSDLNPINAIKGGIDGLTSALFKLGINAGAFGLAVVFIVLGVIVLSRGSIKKVAKTVLKATPVGKVVK